MTPYSMEYAHKFMHVYELKSREVSKSFGLTQTAFDIILFLANNPDFHTARDIVEIRKIKANLVSVNVEKLVQEGYLTRSSVPGDRRKVSLSLTPKAAPIIEQGQTFQMNFFRELAEGIDEADLQTFRRILRRSEENIDRMMQLEEKVSR